MMTRLGTPDDFTAMQAFDPFSFGDRLVALREQRCMVAESEGAIVGFAEFSVAGFIGRPFVHFLAVAETARRKGVAIALLDAVALHIGSGRLFISTEQDNAPMHALLARHGWTLAGCVEGVNFNGVAECFFFRDLST